MPDDNRVSVAIIGGGPAGATAAALLARGGVDVTLIEQSRSGRDKVCGECLSPLGTQALARSGLAGAVRRLNPVRLQSVRFASAGRELRIALPCAMWGLTRRSLDAALLEAALSAGARLRRPASALQIISTPTAPASPGGAGTGRTSGDGAAPAVIVRDLQTNRIERLDADLVLLADGKSALMGAKPRHTGELGIKAYFHNVLAPENEISLFSLRGHYLGLAPVSDGDRVVWNLAAAVPVQRLREFRGDHDALLGQMRGQNRALEEALAGAKRIGDWHSCALPRFAVRKKWPRGVIPLGNAAAALEPIGGEGMGLAIASAELAARYILEGRTAGAELRALQGELTALWRWRSPAWRGLAMVMSRPLASRLLIGAARAVPSGLRVAIESRLLGLAHRSNLQPACVA